MTSSTVTVSLQAPEGAGLASAVAALVADRVASRITAQDPTLWGPDAEAESSIRLAWVGLAETSRPLVERIVRLRDELRSEGVDRVVLAGMGGSSLAPEVLCATAGVPLTVLDTTDPQQVRRALDPADLARTVLVVSSKSGGTVETDSHRRIFAAAFAAAGIDAARRIVVVTDPGSPLAELAGAEGYREVFLADPHVGGRYSALTAFGLVPAGLAGVDPAALLDQAAAVVPVLAADDPDNPALRLGALLGVAHAAGSEKVVMAEAPESEADRIPGFGAWAEQLIAESTGKEGRGLLPVAVEDVSAAGFADAGGDATTVALGARRVERAAASGFGAAVAGSVAASMLLWEYAVVIAGRLIGINPFDQPDVEAAKAAARGLLDAPSAPSGSDPSIASVDIGAVTVTGPAGIVADAASLAEVWARLFSSAPPAGYVAIQAYLDRLGDEAAGLRAPVSARSGLQTTFGWGPRFLHSTGQYHKGGHPNGVFVQIIGGHAEDLAIPGRPYRLGELQHAQAHGDAAVLREHGRPVLTVALTDRARGLAELAAALAT